MEGVNSRLATLGKTQFNSAPFQLVHCRRCENVLWYKMVDGGVSRGLDDGWMDGWVGGWLAGWMMNDR